MRKKLAVWTLLAAVGGFASPAAQAGKFMSQAYNQQPEGARVGASYVPGAPNMVGPYGQPVEMVAPAVLREPTGADYARAAIMKTYPNELLQAGRLPEGTGAVVNANYPPPDALASG